MSNVVPHFERACWDHCWDVAAAFSGAGDVAGVLAEDAGTVRPLACREESAKGGAVPACGNSRAAGIESAGFVIQVYLEFCEITHLAQMA